MDAFTTLLNTYSLEGIIVFIITLMFAIKAIGTTVEWIWGKVQKKLTSKRTVIAWTKSLSVLIL